VAESGFWWANARQVHAFAFGLIYVRLMERSRSLGRRA